MVKTSISCSVSLLCSANRREAHVLHRPEPRPEALTAGTEGLSQRRPQAGRGTAGRDIQSAKQLELELLKEPSVH